MPTIDDARLLKNFREASDGVVGDVHHGAILIRRLLALVVIKAGIDRTDVTKLLPRSRVVPTTKIDAPDDTSCREFVRVGRQGLEVTQRG